MHLDRSRCRRNTAGFGPAALSPHPLKGALKGMWAVTVRATWRIVFRFEGTDVFDVELVDH
jgi:plasmid maintenance system killer protein